MPTEAKKVDIGNEAYHLAENKARDAKGTVEVGSEGKIEEADVRTKSEERSYLETAKDKVTEAYVNVKETVGDAFETAKEKIVSTFEGEKDPTAEARERAHSATMTIGMGIGEADGQMKAAAVRNGGDCIRYKCMEAKERMCAAEENTETAADRALQEMDQRVEKAPIKIAE